MMSYYVPAGQQAFQDPDPHLQPIQDAVKSGAFALAFTTANPGILMTHPDAQEILIIGDDLDESVGPDAFDHEFMDDGLDKSCVSAVMVGLSAAAYKAVVEYAAKEGQSVFIVETRAVHAKAWVDYIQGRRGKDFRILEVKDPTQ